VAIPIQAFATAADPIDHDGRSKRGNYVKRDGQFLKVGETVVFIVYPVSSAGKITDRLDDDYVLVRWADFSTPTTHRTRLLRRA
jgi:hypothetical protein